MTFADLMTIYMGSNGTATLGLYDRLESMGPDGIIAMNLFRACKASERAKLYRGAKYSGMAYEKKDWSLKNLCEAMREHKSPWRWGWGRDNAAVGFENVLFIDLPTGQVSFHNSRRYPHCPDYPGEWDRRKGEAPTRICRWIATLFEKVQA